MPRFGEGPFNTEGDAEKKITLCDLKQHNKSVSRMWKIRIRGMNWTADSIYHYHGASTWFHERKIRKTFWSAGNTRCVCCKNKQINTGNIIQRQTRPNTNGKRKRTPIYAERQGEINKNVISVDSYSKFIKYVQVIQRQNKLPESTQSHSRK